MDTKMMAVIGGIVLIAVVVCVGAYASGILDTAETGDDGESEIDVPVKADIRYDYKLELVDVVNDINHPDEGMQFLLVSYIVANDSDDTLKTALVEWSAAVDGAMYSERFTATVSAPGYQGVDVPPGYTATSAAAVEVPAGHSVDDFELFFEYGAILSDYTIQHDDSLL